MKEIIKYTGKVNDFGPNFLFNKDKVFLMDTKTIAVWCWLQKIDVTKQYNFLQIDSDIEYSTFRFMEYEEELRKIDLHTITLDDFGKPVDQNNLLAIEDIMWKNSLGLLNYKYPDLLNEVHLATHNTPSDNFPLNYASYYVHDIQTWIEKILESKNNLNSIVNIDMSFFFADKEENFDGSNDGAEKIRMLTDEYIEVIGSALKKCMDKIEVLLVTVNPRICSLEKGITAVKVLLKKLDLDFPAL